MFQIKTTTETLSMPTSGIPCSWVIATISASSAIFYFLHHLRIRNLSSELAKAKSLRAEERRGRIRAEKRLREEASNSASSHLDPIGIVESPFPDRRGTPRQAQLVRGIRSRLRFERRIQPEISLSGLEQFSHIWVLGLFHENTNIGSSKNISAKIRPPRLNGLKTGIYSTRTPHRHNPISLSLARIENLDLENAVLVVSGLDLVHGTPILDVKPYIPRYDRLPDPKAPGWIEELDQEKKFEVKIQICDKEMEYLRKHCTLQFYKSADEAVGVIREILAYDIRSLHQKNSGKSIENLYEFRFDGFYVRYRILHDENVVSISSLFPDPIA